MKYCIIMTLQQQKNIYLNPHCVASLVCDPHEKQEAKLSLG